MLPALPFFFPGRDVNYLGASQSAVIHTLAYFSLFEHPLRRDELARYLHFCPVTDEGLSATLNELSNLGIIETSGPFYYLAGQEYLVLIRKYRNALARPWFRKLKTSVLVLAQVPFLEGLALSGSLSKGTQELDGDLDFMLLCRPGKLWTTGLFVRLLQKLLGRAQQKRFCTNFLLASDNLSIPQRDLFTATEIVFLAPLVNGQLWRAFFQQNAWVRNFYPNWVPPPGIPSKVFRLPLSGLLEWAFSGDWGDWFVQTAFQWAADRRRRKSGSLYEARSPIRTDAAEVFTFKRTRATQLHDEWGLVLDTIEARHNVSLTRWNWEWKQAPQLPTVPPAPLGSWYRPDASSRPDPA